ncbi:MAG: hypothetical protein ACJ72E_07705 [Marmoricola sp.]
MSGLDGSVAGPHSGSRRVRHEVRDGIAVMAFSAGVSTAIALLCLLLVGLGN